MDIETKIKENFKEVEKAFFVKEFNQTFLKIQTSLSKLDDITELSRKISDFLDDIEIEEENYFLDVYSHGTDQIIKIDDLKNHINENIFIALKETLKEKLNFEGTLLSINEDSLVVKWNNKGQFRKQEIIFSIIEEVKTYSKINK